MEVDKMCEVPSTPNYTKLLPQFAASCRLQFLKFTQLSASLWQICRCLRLVVMVMSRHDMTKNTKVMANWLLHANIRSFPSEEYTFLHLFPHIFISFYIFIFISFPVIFCHIFVVHWPSCMRLASTRNLSSSENLQRCLLDWSLNISHFCLIDL